MSVNRIWLSHKLAELQEMAWEADAIITNQHLPVPNAPVEWTCPDFPEFRVNIVEVVHDPEGEPLHTEIDERTTDLEGLLGYIEECNVFSNCPARGEGWWSYSHTCMYTGQITENTVHVEGLTDDEWTTLHHLVFIRSRRD